MDATKAATLFQHLEAADREMVAAFNQLKEIDDLASPELYERRLAGLIADLFFGVTQPLYQHYPALMPPAVAALRSLPAEVQAALFDRRGPQTPPIAGST